MSIPTPLPPQTVKHSAGVSVIRSDNETMRITGPGGGAVWLQGGKLYDDVGKVIEVPPPWFDDEFKKLSKEMQKKHALGDRKVDPGLAMRAEAEAVENDSEEDLERMTKAELIAVAEMESVDFHENDTKAVIISKILESRGQ